MCLPFGSGCELRHRQYVPVRILEPRHLGAARKGANAQRILRKLFVAFERHTRGAELFRKCAACHTLTPEGDHRAGPTLYRLFGRTAGSRPDYPYSSALETSDLVWTEQTVARLFEVGPEVLVPGSKMPLQRMPDARDRADLIAYLKRVTEPDGGG